MIVSAALAAALMRETHFRSCVGESGQTARAYAAQAFDARRLTLRSGDRVVVLVAKPGCMWRGQAASVLAFRQSAQGFRLVLDAASLPERVDATPDGMLHLATHETVNTIVNATWVWNGRAYVFAPERSTIYCVGPEQDNERPYELPVHFARGATSKILRGSAAQNCGQDYSVFARAGQRLTIELLTRQPAMVRIAVVVSFGDSTIASLDGKTWSGELPRSGKYVLSIFGNNQHGPMKLEPFAVKVTIR